jgi:uncharacterized protein (DUF1501 family)
MKPIESPCDCSRRSFLRAGLGFTAGLPLFLHETDLVMAANHLIGADNGIANRILVVLELSGGNDGLNTVVPYTNDIYYRERPTIAIAKNNVLKLNDEFGFHNNLPGWERLFKDGKMAIVQGCGYPNPNRSHFESMKFWHSGVPNSQEPNGWLGRLSNELSSTPQPAMLVNLADKMSDALRGSLHPTVVFNDPNRFIREGTDEQKEVFRALASAKAKDRNGSLNFVRAISSTADQSSDFIRRACAEYRAKNDYGYGQIGPVLQRIAAQIAAGAKTRIYYTAMGGYDTHGAQTGGQGGLFNQIGDALLGFQRDLEKLGRDGDVALMMFSEFGRRVKENASQGTDHGVAGPMFLVGKHVKGGFYGKFPSLSDLDAGDLKMTTDFRSVYATMIREWMGFGDAKSVLKAEFPTLGAFAA